jgi:hypothetical protein
MTYVSSRSSSREVYTNILAKPPSTIEDENDDDEEDWLFPGQSSTLTLPRRPKPPVSLFPEEGGKSLPPGARGASTV